MSDETCPHGINYKSECRECDHMIWSNQMGGLVLRGWICVCGIFNGEEKEPRATCRTCDRERWRRP